MVGGGDVVASEDVAEGEEMDVAEAEVVVGVEVSAAADIGSGKTLRSFETPLLYAMSLLNESTHIASYRCCHISCIHPTLSFSKFRHYSVRLLCRSCLHRSREGLLRITVYERLND